MVNSGNYKSVRLKGLRGREGILADTDFTGKLDILTVLPDGTGLSLFRNLGSFYFQEDTGKSGLPQRDVPVEHVAVGDFTGEDLPMVFLTAQGKPAKSYIKQRAASFVETEYRRAFSLRNLPRSG